MCRVWLRSGRRRRRSGPGPGPRRPGRARSKRVGTCQRVAVELVKISRVRRRVLVEETH